MSEQRSREASEVQAQPIATNDLRDERPSPKEEFRSYSLELLVVLEG